MLHNLFFLQGGMFRFLFEFHISIYVLKLACIQFGRLLFPFVSIVRLLMASHKELHAYESIDLCNIRYLNSYAFQYNPPIYYDEIIQNQAGGLWNVSIAMNKFVIVWVVHQRFENLRENGRCMGFLGKDRVRLSAS